MLTSIDILGEATSDLESKLTASSYSLRGAVENYTKIDLPADERIRIMQKMMKHAGRIKQVKIKEIIDVEDNTDKKPKEQKKYRKLSDPVLKKSKPHKRILIRYSFRR